MPSLRELARHPERRRPDPPPARIDLARVLRIGTFVWTLGLVGVVVDLVRGEPAEWKPLWICAAGVALGLLGIWWASSNRARWDPTPVSSPDPTPHPPNS